MKKDRSRTLTLVAKVCCALRRGDGQVRQSLIKAIQLKVAAWRAQKKIADAFLYNKSQEDALQQRRRMVAATLATASLIPAIVRPAHADTAFTSFAFLGQG